MFRIFVVKFSSFPNEYQIFYEENIYLFIYLLTRKMCIILDSNTQ